MRNVAGRTLRFELAKHLVYRALEDRRAREACDVPRGEEVRSEYAGRRTMGGEIRIGASRPASRCCAHIAVRTAPHGRQTHEVRSDGPRSKIPHLSRDGRATFRDPRAVGTQPPTVVP